MTADYRDIPGFPNYAVTKDGRVWSKPRTKTRGGWLKPYFHKFGYPMVQLYGNKVRRVAVHTLVLETYIGPRPKGTVCMHLNNEPACNKLKNICWGTQSENIKDSVTCGTHPRLGANGPKNPTSKLTEEQVRLIFNAYHDGIYLQRELAKQFEVSPTCIQKIVNKQMWAYLWND